MTVTADGQFIETDPGVGIRQPGWHAAPPEPRVQVGPPQLVVLREKWKDRWKTGYMKVYLRYPDGRRTSAFNFSWGRRGNWRYRVGDDVSRAQFREEAMQRAFQALLNNPGVIGRDADFERIRIKILEKRYRKLNVYERFIKTATAAFGVRG